MTSLSRTVSWIGIGILLCSGRLSAQATSPVVRETVSSGVTYDVTTTTSVSGTLPVSDNRPAGKTELRIEGGTHYREKVLQLTRTGEAAKAIRHYLDIH